ncbi:hypothetical protein [Sporisorium scitamineum]|uniref:Uncharacterized protein n=1 Tax=Sporisorium scitamineum TaxID=49012 RepID=A0A0F7S264_9BASI|nr:hypothetical protein [Sporisorium scitamineum]
MKSILLGTVQLGLAFLSCALTVTWGSSTGDLSEVNSAAGSGSSRAEPSGFVLIHSIPAPIYAPWQEESELAKTITDDFKTRLESVVKPIAIEVQQTRPPLVTHPDHQPIMMDQLQRNNFEPVLHLGPSTNRGGSVLAYLMDKPHNIEYLLGPSHSRRLVWSILEVFPRPDAHINVMAYLQTSHLSSVEARDRMKQKLVLAAENEPNYIDLTESPPLSPSSSRAADVRGQPASQLSNPLTGGMPPAGHPIPRPSTIHPFGQTVPRTNPQPQTDQIPGTSHHQPSSSHIPGPGLHQSSGHPLLPLEFRPGILEREYAHMIAEHVYDGEPVIHCSGRPS